MRGIAATLSLVLLGASALGAQVPDAPAPLAWRSVAALHDSLSHIAHRAALDALEAALPDSDDDAAALSVMRGLIALRSFELEGAATDARRARQEFERARDIDRVSPWPDYGLALLLLRTEAARGEPTIVTGLAFERALGLDPYSRTRRHLRRALELDPSFAPAARLLVDVAFELRDNDALDDALVTLAHARDPASQLALSRAAAGLGHLELAADAAGYALAADAATSAAARRALAIAVLRQPGREAEGGRLWLEAVDHMTEAVARALLEDVRAIARPAELARWDALDHAGRADWLRSFWEVRAAAAGITPAERIAEHYRRLAAATDRFPRRVRWGAPPLNSLNLERVDLPFDDRGLIFVRHGEPRRVIRTLDPDLPQNESWLYDGIDGRDRMFHFANYGSPLPAGSGISRSAGGGYAEWLLVYNLPCGGQYAADRATYEPRLTTLARRCDAIDVRMISAEIRRDAYEALRTDSDFPPFTRPLPFTYDLYTFRGEGGTELTAVLAVTEAPDAVGAVDALQTLDVSLIVMDTASSTVARADTTVAVPRERATPAVANLTLRATPSSSAQHRILVKSSADPGHGRLRGGPVHIPDYSGDTLMISDVVLAADSTGEWRRGEVRLLAVPSAEFARGEIDVFYEVYNLRPLSPYTTELLVEPVGGGPLRAIGRLFGRDRRVHLRFDGIAPQSTNVVRELRHMTAPLRPGRYRITVTVSTPGRNARPTRSREFTIVNSAS
jgi:hypothetical protein